MVSSSSHSFSAVLLLALLLSSSADHANAGGINPLLPVCKTVGGGSMFVGIDFCLAALGSDSRSRDAESYRNFSIIAVDLLTANVTSTASKIDGLLRNGHDAATTKSLGSCQALYRGIEARQPGCAAAVKGGRFKEAQASLEMSASAAKQCEDGFGRSKVASPLAVEDDNAFQLAKLAVELLNLAT